MREETERRKIRIDLIDIDGEPIPKRPNPTQMGYFNSKDRGASKSHFRISNPDIEIIEPYCDFDEMIQYFENITRYETEFGDRSEITISQISRHNELRRMKQK